MSSQLKGRGGEAGHQLLKSDSHFFAEWVHCRSYCINLAMTFASKNRHVTDFMDILTSVCYYFANSSKRHQYLERFIEHYKNELSLSESSRRFVIGLCETPSVFKFIVATFDSICNPHLYEDFCNTWKMKLMKAGVGTVNSLTKQKEFSHFDHIISFSVLFPGLEPAEPHVTKLQTKSQGICQAYYYFKGNEELIKFVKRSTRFK